MGRTGEVPAGRTGLGLRAWQPLQPDEVNHIMSGVSSEGLSASWTWCP